MCESNLKISLKISLEKTNIYYYYFFIAYDTSVKKIEILRECNSKLFTF